MSARFVMPTGGAFGAGGVVDADGAVAAHVVVEPDVATPPTGRPTGARCQVVGLVKLLVVPVLLLGSPVWGRRRIPR